jgi:hypothetical protein
MWLNWCVELIPEEVLFSLRGWQIVAWLPINDPLLYTVER